MNSVTRPGMMNSWWRLGSGPRVASLYHRLLAICALTAWLSLAVQVKLLIGSQGLLPIEPLVRSYDAANQWIFPRFPSFLLFFPSDTAIDAGVAAGVVLSLLALLGVFPRIAFALSAPLYLGYAVAGRQMLSFQWDNLLVECLVLAVFLSHKRRSPGAHWIMRVLLFKIYFESGIAKASSYLGDWFDGSAMHFYYETAPLPAWPAWYAHHLPDFWHDLESWGALGLELFGAFLILGPRRCRLAALAGFTGFQVLNLATANYGFFVWLTLSLHVFLLDDGDLARLGAWLRARLPAWRPAFRARWPLGRPAAETAPRRHPRLRTSLGAALALLWIVCSGLSGFTHLGPAGRLRDAATGWVQTFRPYRVANAYHLFGHITRKRIEPEIQIESSGQPGQPGQLRAYRLHYKPGDPMKAPSFVAPHQPRIDFLLWFHGLGFERSTPQYVTNLVERICTVPASVQPLFAEPLPIEPASVRIEYWRYHFTSPEERAESGAWWKRRSVAISRRVDCERVRRRRATGAPLR